MRVFGTQGPLGPKDVLADPAGNFVIELGEAIELQTSYKNLTASGFDLIGALTGISAPLGYTGTILDANANFGQIAAGGTNSCVDGADCYMIRYDGAGFGHRDGMLDEAVQILRSGPQPARRTSCEFRPMHIGGSFLDVPTTQQFYRFIETVLHHQVTGGCSIPNSTAPTT